MISPFLLHHTIIPYYYMVSDDPMTVPPSSKSSVEIMHTSSTSLNKHRRNVLPKHLLVLNHLLLPNHLSTLLLTESASLLYMELIWSLPPKLRIAAYCRSSFSNFTCCHQLSPHDAILMLPSFLKLPSLPHDGTSNIFRLRYVLLLWSDIQFECLTSSPPLIPLKTKFSSTNSPPRSSASRRYHTSSEIISSKFNRSPYAFL
jgi:hypothetical protein